MPDVEKLSAIKKASNRAAGHMEEFVQRAYTEIPFFRDGFKDAMSATQEMFLYLGDFERPEKSELEGTLENLTELRNSMNSTREQNIEFVVTVKSLPRMTTIFNRSKRRTIAVVNDIIQVMDDSIKLLIQAELSLKDLGD